MRRGQAAWEWGVEALWAGFIFLCLVGIVASSAVLAAYLLYGYVP